MVYEYYINLNERGDFNADVRTVEGETIFEIHSAEQMAELVEDGFMRHTEDVTGLCEMLRTHKVIPTNSRIIEAN